MANLVRLLAILNLEHTMDKKIQSRIAADDLTSEEADALDWDRASDFNDESRDMDVMKELNDE